ncbi:MAG: thymidylate synthase, partial [Candidatus Aerophobetes bacterium]|nr:thymidylate synthase [Candidatus Aerophobetes bacterium]
MKKNNKTNIETGCPIVKVVGKTLPEAWEKSVVRCWEEGVEIKTEYDRPGDPPSKDCTMIMEVNHPLKEPRLHRAFPAGLADLEVYRQEVILGVHDDWINPEEGKWEYTYHERLFNYKVEGRSIDQIDYVVRKLSETPYSRRGQTITWKPWLDPNSNDPPCLQRLFFRIFEDNLQLNVHFRSNDAFKAAFMNMFVLTELQKLVAEK